MTALVDVFVEASNRGDQATLWALLPDESVPNEAGVIRYVIKRHAGPDVDTGSRAELMAEFARRHARRERWELRRLDIGEGGVRAGIRIAPTGPADDMPLRTFEGKGRVDCEQQRIVLWSMVEPVPQAPAPG